MAAPKAYFYTLKHILTLKNPLFPIQFPYICQYIVPKRALGGGKPLHRFFKILEKENYENGDIFSKSWKITEITEILEVESAGESAIFPQFPAIFGGLP